MRRNLVLAIFCLTLSVICCSSLLVAASEPHSFTDTPLDQSIPASADSSSSHPHEFVATHEWQIVQPGQHIPPGLHVRMDVNTGEKMARLIPEEELNEPTRRANARQASEELAIVMSDAVKSIAEGGEGGPHITALPLPSADTSVTDNEVTPPSEADLLAARQERLRLLKEHFYLREDAERMKQLINICIDESSSIDEILSAMEILEEYLHQVDNAADWTKIGGLDVALMYLQQKTDKVDTTTTTTTTQQVPSSSDDNATSSMPPPPAPLDLQAYRLYSLQSQAAWVLGTAAQNNRFVQDNVGQEGTVEILTQLYRHTLDDEFELRASGDDINSVTSFQLLSSRYKLFNKLLYALSSVLRNHAKNQARFHALNGEALLLRDVRPSWKSCGDDSPNTCINAAEDKTLYKLLDTILAKRLNLLHDFIIDHTVNSNSENPTRSIAEPSASSAAADVHSPPRPDVSDPHLFASLVENPFCRLYLNLARYPGVTLRASGTDLTTLQLTTRELALNILHALTTHPNHSSGGLCAPITHTAEFDLAMQSLYREHHQLAAKAALDVQSADEAASEDSAAKYHHELMHTIEQIMHAVPKQTYEGVGAADHADDRPDL